MMRATHSCSQVYSNGLSEIMLGNAIKKMNLPREEIVVMTKANGCQIGVATARMSNELLSKQVFNPVLPRYDAKFAGAGKGSEEFRLVNQSGLSRKVIDASEACTFLVSTQLI